MTESEETQAQPFQISCPLPLGFHKEIQIGHGGGGRLSQQLIEEVFLPAFSNNSQESVHDGAVLSANGDPIAFSTDSHVVRPIEFPGGDIGSLAIHGTANDVAMCGARPRWISAGFILEEGLSMEVLHRIVHSMRKAADEIGLQIVTGDTKVVERGKGDGIYINTSGIGQLLVEPSPSPGLVREGDVIVLSGDIGRHGMAIMAQREGLEFETTIQSDSAHLWPAVKKLLDEGMEIHCLRDLTRGGLASAMHEIAHSAKCSISLDEAEIRSEEAVLGACEVLGLDVLHVANEGRFIAIVPERCSESVLKLLQESAPGGDKAAIIGRVGKRSSPTVHLKSVIGVERILDRPSGEQLPRIC